MKIKFEEMSEEKLDNFKGGEGHFNAKMHVDELGKILMGRLAPGNTIGYHVHDSSSEIIYMLSGTAICNFDGGEEILTAGDCHYCPKGHSHGLQCAEEEPITFFAIVPEQ